MPHIEMVDSSCLTKAICSAYCHQGREHQIIHANPHSIWGVATSWAKKALEICCAATWSGPCTFAQFYQLDFSGDGFGMCSQNGHMGWISVKANANLKHHFSSSLPVPSLSWHLPVAGIGVLHGFPRTTPGELGFLDMGYYRGVSFTILTHCTM